MKIISSQKYINWDTVDEKIAEMEASGIQTLTVPCWEAGEIDGEEYAVVSDAHHRMVAARELGIEIEFEVVEHPEGLTGMELLEVAYMDSDWYDVETSDWSAEQYDMVW